MRYTTKLDTSAIIITTALTFLFAALIMWQWSISDKIGNAAPIFTTSICVLIYLISYALRPLRYSITGDEVIVHRLFRNVHIKIPDVTQVSAIPRREIFGSFRAFGVGGLFGYTGSFVNASVGRMSWYATNLNKAVLIVTGTDKRIILTPEEREQFIATLKM
jgi:hypothetical protein